MLTQAIPLGSRPRRLVCGLAAVFVGLVMLALANTSVARSDQGGTPDSRLLSAYQPVLVFHPAELFRPTKVQSFVADSQLEQFTGTSTAQLPLDSFWRVVDPILSPASSRLRSRVSSTASTNRAAKPMPRSRVATVTPPHGTTVAEARPFTAGSYARRPASSSSTGSSTTTTRSCCRPRR